MAEQQNGYTEQLAAVTGQRGFIASLESFTSKRLVVTGLVVYVAGRALFNATDAVVAGFALGVIGLVATAYIVTDGLVKSAQARSSATVANGKEKS